MIRRRPIWLWGLGTLLGLPSCGGEQRKAETPSAIRVGDEKPQDDVEPAPTPEVKGVIVWSRPEDSEQETSYWLDPEGNVLREQSGIFLLAQGKEWEFSKSLGRMPVYDCETVMGGAVSEPTEYKETVVPSLIDEKTHRRWELWGQPKPGPEERYNDYSQNAGLMASAGRYLVIGDFTYGYGCGAHGFSVVEYSAYDLVTKQKVPLLSPAEMNELKGHELASAVAAFKAEGQGFDEPTEGQLTLINVIPEVTPDGKQRAQLVFSIGTCYACTHGEGSSYTATTRVVAESLPRALSEQPLPKSVARFAASHPIRGWSAN